VHILELVQKFRKLLSSHVEPILLRIGANFESSGRYRTDKREWQFSVEGGVGKLDSDIGKLAEAFNFLPNAVPSLTGNTGNFGEFDEFGIDFAV
jgi:hypothetical protein